MDVLIPTAVLRARGGDDGLRRDVGKTMAREAGSLASCCGEGGRPEFVAVPARSGVDDPLDTAAEKKGTNA